MKKMIHPNICLFNLFVFLSECGTPLHESVGVIQSRGYPDRFEHGDCVWHIHPNNKSVLLLFEYIDIPHSQECRYAVIKTVTGGRILHAKILLHLAKKSKEIQGNLVRKYSIA